MTEPKRSFFAALRKRIEVEPGREFDRAFWRKFDSEFGPKRSRWRELWAAWNLQIALPVAAGIAIVAGATLYLRGAGDSEMLGESAEFAVILENREMIEELDLYAELDALDLPDEEFDAILAEAEGGEG